MPLVFPQLVRSSAGPGVAGLWWPRTGFCNQGASADAAGAVCPAQPHFRDVAKEDVTQGIAFDVGGISLLRKACPYKLIPQTFGQQQAFKNVGQSGEG